MIPESVKAKVESYVNDLVDKLDEMKRNGADITSVATGRMTVMRADGWEYEITTTIKAKGPK